MATTRRLYLLDNLKVALTILVIAHHAGQAYGPTGGWWPIQEATRAPVLGPFFTVNRSFFMSLFFMISGYLMVMDYDLKGPGEFVKRRLLRLGVPALVFALCMIPLQFYVFGEPPADWRSLDWSSVINVGHLWYIEHLLLFSLCYALGRTFWKGRGPVAEAERKSPGYLAVLAFALALAVASAVIRIWYPIDRWVNLLGFMRVALADVPRDLSFFIIGAVAYRHDWFLRFPTGAGRVWLGVGVVAAASWYAYALGLRQVFPVSGMAMGVVYPIWEALLCCGMCIGLLVLFREKVDLQGRLLSAMARNQYAAYVVHVSVLILIQYAVAGIHWPPLVKFALVVLVGVPLTFLFSDWIRQPAFMRKVL